MPYIKPDNREVIDPLLDPLVEKLGPLDISEAGDLNYIITRIITKYLIAMGVNYDHVNTVSGVLQKVQAEFDARVTRPYEEVKVFQNGDVPEYSQIEALIRKKQSKLPISIAPDAEQAHG